MSRENEAYMPREMVQRVLASATRDVVLIGGQALAYWMDYYGVQEPDDMAPAVSRDVDFFTCNAANSLPLANFARAIGGRTEVADMEAITALVGSAVAPADADRIYNVDLLHQVVGLERAEIDKHAVEVSLQGGATIRVMHPIHVLRSRNANLHSLTEKQDEIGQKQYLLAIAVARAHLESRIDAIEARKDMSDRGRERAIFDLIGSVSDYSTEDAASKNAERYGIFLADAIPAWRIGSAAFWKSQWPRLRGRMSPDYADQCEEQAGRDS